MGRWVPHLVFPSVNRKLAWRLLAPMLVVTGLSGAGAKKRALPNLWEDVRFALDKVVAQEVAPAIQDYFAVSFIFAVLGILFLVMVLSRAVDLQLVYFAGSASFALSFLWLVCAVMSLLPTSLMGLHRVFVVIVVVVTVASQFVRGGTMKYYWDNRHYGDLTMQALFLGSYLALARIPLVFAVTGRVVH